MDLAEAIALAHDVGHTPFGHVGEEKLKELLEEYNIPFEHNIQSYRITTSLERRYSTFEGLNLTYATREGIIRHRTFFDKEEDIKNGIPKELEDELKVFWDIPQPSLEAQIASLADIIAYSSHDLEDALTVGLLKWRSFEDKVDELNISFIKNILDDKLQTRIREFEENISKDEAIIKQIKPRMLSRYIIEELIIDASKSTMRELKKCDNKEKACWQSVRENKRPIVSLSKQLESEVRKLVEEFLFNSVYKEPRVMIMREKAERILETLFNTFMDKPEAMPKITQAKLPTTKKYRKRQLAQIVADFISGMTDKYAMDTYQLLTQAYEKAL